MSRHFAGAASDSAETRNLEQWILADTRHAERFAREAILNSAIGAILRSNSICHHHSKRQRLQIGLKALVVAAMLVASLTAGIYFFAPSSRSVQVIGGRLDAAVDARWSRDLAPGDQLPSSPTKLLAGTARLLLADNTEVILSAPSEFRSTPERFTLLSGKAVCLSLAASPRATAIQAGEASIQRVSDGPMELAIQGTALQVLTGSVAVRVQDHLQTISVGDGPRSLLDPMVAVAGFEFFRHAEFALLQRAKSSPWAARRLDLRNDPSLLFCSDLTIGFGSGSLDGRVFSMGVISAAPLVTDDLTAPLATEGRSADDAALSFTRDSQSLRTNLPGGFQALTLAAWVRLYSEDLSRNRHRGLIMADGWNKSGLIHWQLKGNSFRLSFFERGDNKDRRFTGGSDALWDGQWHFITSVIDLTGSTPAVGHYVDGERVAWEAIPREQVPVALRLGPCSIGGWRPYPNADDPDRHLNGALDDLLVFSRALSPREIEKLFLESK